MNAFSFPGRPQTGTRLPLIATLITLTAPVAGAQQFSNVSDAAGIIHQISRAWGNPVWGDLNNDGYLDLIVPVHELDYLGGPPTPFVYLNNKDGTFTELAVSSGQPDNKDWLGISLGDYDGDGKLDFFAAEPPFQNGGDGSPTSMAPARNVLYRGNGDGTFTYSADAAGLEVGRYYGECGYFVDYDNDGKLDLFVKNLFDPVDGGVNVMYRNNGDGTFTQVASAAGLADATHGVVDGTIISFADYDNDGFMDVVMGGNEALYRNVGGTFTDVTASAGITPRANALGFAWGDYNNDGFLDLVVQDGIAPTKLTGESATGYHYLFKNNGNANHFLKVNLKGTTSNRAGIGARVTATYADGQAFRENSGGGGGDYASQGSEPLHFGIGSAATATLQVAWPSGRFDTVSNVPANSTITVNESQAAMPPIITLQPRGATVRVGQTATFKVTATGVPPLSYQWLKNNVPISGATKASFKTPPVTTDDNGSFFAVIVSDANGSVRSADALLKVKAAL